MNGSLKFRALRVCCRSIVISPTRGAQIRKCDAAHGAAAVVVAERGVGDEERTKACPNISKGTPESRNWLLSRNVKHLKHCVQPADIGNGNGKKLSNNQACCLAQLCLAAACFSPFHVGQTSYAHCISFITCRKIRRTLKNGLVLSSVEFWVRNCVKRTRRGGGKCAVKQN